jgi:uncharacterized membrane protein YtjA (UPF0391 family)
MQPTGPRSRLAGRGTDWLVLAPGQYRLVDAPGYRPALQEELFDPATVTTRFYGGVLMSGMLRWALIFLVISLVAALFGFTGISAATADIARILFFIFVVIFVVLLVLALTASRRV